MAKFLNLISLLTTTTPFLIAPITESIDDDLANFKKNFFVERHNLIDRNGEYFSNPNFILSDIGNNVFSEYKDAHSSGGWEYLGARPRERLADFINRTTNQPNIFEYFNGGSSHFMTTGISFTFQNRKTLKEEGFEVIFQSTCNANNSINSVCAVISPGVRFTDRKEPSDFEKYNGDLSHPHTFNGEPDENWKVQPKVFNHTISFKKALKHNLLAEARSKGLKIASDLIAVGRTADVDDWEKQIINPLPEFDPINGFDLFQNRVVGIWTHGSGEVNVPQANKLLKKVAYDLALEVYLSLNSLYGDQ